MREKHSKKTLAHTVKAGKDLRESFLKQEQLNRENLRKFKIEQTHLENPDTPIENIKQDEAEKLWKEFVGATNDFARDALKGYDNPASAALTQFAYSEVMVKALLHSKPLASLVHFLFEFMRINKGVVYALEWLGKDRSASAVHLPGLHQHIELSDDHKLLLDSITQNIRRSDGEELSPEQQGIVQELFTVPLVISWLDKCGYKPVPTTNPRQHPTEFVSKEDGTPLTKEIFETLRDDPERGFNYYMNTLIDIPVSTMRPQP